MNPCPRCGSADVRTALVSADPHRTHYAERRCARCGAGCGYEPWPRGELDPVAIARLAAAAPPLTDPPSPLPSLRGSPKQIAFARPVRPVLMRRWAPALSPDLKRLVRTVDEAGWWIRNREADCESVKWPRAWCRAAEREAFRER